MNKTLQIITAILFIIYIIVIISDIVELGGSGILSGINIMSVAFFILFLIGAFCCIDYPLITSITFLLWFVLRLFSYKLEMDDNPSYNGVTIFFVPCISIVGSLYMFVWWDKRDKIEN